MELSGWYQIFCLAVDCLLGKKLLYTVAQFLTAGILSTNYRGKAGAKGCLGCMLSPKNLRLGNPMNPLGARGRGV